MAFSKFIQANLNQNKITIYGNGNQSRDFTFISDIIDVNIQASKSSIHGNVLNIGGGSTHSVNQILNMIEDITGNKNIIQNKTKQNGDVIKTESNISKSKKFLNTCLKSP